MTSLLRNLYRSLALVATVAIVSACGGGSSGPTDTVAPSVTITSSASGTTAKAAVTFTFTFSEDVGTSFDQTKVAVTGGTAAASTTKVSATVYTLVVTPTANTNSGSIGVTVGAGAFSDLAGNKSTASATLSQAYDTAAPTVTITSGTSGTATSAVTYTFTFSEDVGTSFDASKVTVTGGTKAASVTKSSATVYTLVVTPTAASSGNIVVSVAAGGFSDAAGNASAAAASFTQAYNTVVAVTIVRAKTDTAAAYDTTNGNALPGNYATGRYAAGAGEEWWWGGNYAEQIQSGYGFSKDTPAQWGFGIYIANGGTGWDISGVSKYHFTLGSNGECANACTVTVRLVWKSDPNCVADYRQKLATADITVAAAAYTANLADFTVKGCTTNTMTAFKAGKVSELHFQMLNADMQFTTPGSGSTKYPNGLGVGGNIYFD